MSQTVFADHTVESAPEAARASMRATTKHFGYLPTAVARMAEAPELLEGFLRGNALFEASTLDPVAREVLVLTIATRNRCHLCVAIHTARLAALGVPAELVEALREQRPLADQRLAAVQRFTLEVLADAGAVPDESLEAFLAHGFTRRNALEVVLGIGVYTMSTLANRLTRAPLDPPLAAYAWPEPAAA
ncbi:carboxymuconolactone decarboxylase family protein [Micromonospora sp. NPDC049559]|uniref:carboxymuconolactone decarboxylase family protein n=1 Tax=Micromonospora sp. NPDC049559 TaxID=3155923 RepID=UPI0034406308